MKDALILIAMFILLIMYAVSIVKSPSSNRMSFHFDWDNYEEITVHPGLILEVPLGCIINVPEGKTLVLNGKVQVEVPK